jgi:hypothetical protein
MSFAKAHNVISHELDANLFADFMIMVAWHHGH